MSQEELQTWITDRLEVVEGDAGTPTLFGLSYLSTSGEETPVHVVKSGTPIWGDATKMAEQFEMHATRFARGVMGSCQFRLGAVYKDNARPSFTLPFLKAGATNIGGGLGIDPSPMGQNMQGQRILDIMAVGTLKERADVVQVLMQTNRMLSDHVLRANDDMMKTRTAFFELEEKVRASQHASKMAELSYGRNTMLLTEVAKHAPIMVNQITGQKWIPESVESATFEERWLASHTDEETTAEIEKMHARDPIFAAFLASRLAEVKNRRVEEGKLQKKMEGRTEETNGTNRTTPPKQVAAAKETPVAQQVDIDVTRNHALSIEAARIAVDGLVTMLHETIEFEHEWAGDRLAIANAEGLVGAIDLTADKVRVRVVLPKMMRLMKGVILGRLESELDKAMTRGVTVESPPA